MKMNHVGIMVGDMDKAVEFYTKALGLEIVMGNTKVTEERETAIGRMCIAVFGEGLKWDISFPMTQAEIDKESSKLHRNL